MCRLAECDPYEHVDGTITAIGPGLSASMEQDARGLWACTMTYKGEVLITRHHPNAEAAFDAAWRQHNES